MQFRDYYKTLGVERGATQDEIQREYRKLARKYHPDLSKEPEAEARFKEVAEAYEVLKDPEARARYDQLGPGFRDGQSFAPPPGFSGFEFRAGPGGGAGAGDTGFSDFFQGMFGGRRGGGGGVHFGPGGQGFASSRRRGQPRKGKDAEAEVSITLLEAFHGTKRDLRVGLAGHQERVLTVSIPPGTTEGTKIRLREHGGPGAHGGPRGDVLLRVKFEAHPEFRAEGADVVSTLRLAPWEAALGGKARVPTLDGEVELTVPAGIEGGRRLRVKGRGLKNRKTKERGHHLYEVRIVVPRALTDEERALYEQLRDVSPFKPRG